MPYGHYPLKSLVYWLQAPTTWTEGGYWNIFKKRSFFHVDRWFYAYGVNSISFDIFIKSNYDVHIVLEIYSHLSHWISLLCYFCSSIWTGVVAGCATSESFCSRREPIWLTKPTELCCTKFLPSIPSYNVESLPLISFNWTVGAGSDLNVLKEFQNMQHLVCYMVTSL